MKRRLRLSLLTLACLSFVALLFYVFLPRSQRTQLAAICRVEACNCYAVSIPSGDTLFLSLRTDSLQDASLMASEVEQMQSQSGAFVSNVGDVLTSDMLTASQPDTLTTFQLRQRLESLDTLLTHRLQTSRNEERELNEFARTHTVVDDGYNDVMAYRESVVKRSERTDSVLKKVKLLLSRGKKLPTSRLLSRVWVRVPCVKDKLAARVMARKNGLLLLRLIAERLPVTSCRFSVYRWGLNSKHHRLFAFNDFGSQSAARAPVCADTSCKLFPAAEGGVWVNSFGHLSGLQSGEEIIPNSKVVELMREVHFWPSWWLTNLVGWIREWSFTRSSLPAMPANDVKSVSVTYPDSSSYEGEVSMKSTSGKLVRQGYGVLRFSSSVSVEGHWRADTLREGKRMDKTGVYEGRLDSTYNPQGQGRFYGRSGEVYDGEWARGYRSGHGFSSKAGQMVRCGSWSKGRFQGERMIYTADRVYGIDLSRYQHEKGKRFFLIKWKSLRITSLGADRRIKGVVDYPVSFVYVKSTEGRTLYNKYYASDIRQARAHGIAVGSYHFFSPSSTGDAQAAHFLKKSMISSSDLPPVLDLEPTSSQIKQMGGDAGMFRQVMAWLRRVEKRTGKRPVLYVSQLFVNNHLNKAPAELRNYDVWIARYGEFKPYVKLLHWQVSPYGRVRGIQTEVDVNVFNGTREDFEHYLKKGRL